MEIDTDRLADQLVTAALRSSPLLAADDPSFRALLDALPAVVYLADAGSKRTLRYMSPRVEEVGGLPADRWLKAADPWREWIHPDDLPRVACALAAVEDGAALNVDYRVVSPEGTVRIVRDRAVTVHDGAGRPTLLQGVLIELDLPPAEMTGDQSAAALAALGDGLDALSEGLLVQDSAGRILSANRSAARIMGVDPEGLLGRMPFDALAGAWYEDGTPVTAETAPTARALSGSEQGRDVAMRLLRTDGTEVSISITHQILRRGNSGPPLGLVCSFIDLTERERTERALREERDRAQRYLDVAGTMIVVVGADEAVRLVNRKGLDLLGAAEEDLTGRNWFETAIAEEDRDGARGAFRRLLSGETAGAESFETAVLGRLGDRRIVSWNATLLRDAEGLANGMLASGEDITDRRRAEHQITYLAYHDDLTGLPNRTLLREHLELALARSRRHGTEVALLFLDLDNFKLVNDSLGHIAGDQILCRLAARLQRVTRETDLLARQGGDEFLLLLTDLEPEGGQAIAETVADHVCEGLQEPFTIAGAEFHVGASIGISLYPRDAEDADALLMHADAAMYQAKAGGDGGHQVYDGTGPDPLERLEMTTRLRRALERDEFRLHYQPIFSLCDGELMGVEALIRWQDPERGMVSPGAFIPVAEDTGLIEPIGDWVVAEICRQAAAWRDEGIEVQMSFNVSPRQLRRPELAGMIRHLVAEHRLDPSRFTVEITETATLRDPERTEPILDELHAIGVQLAIDDFGAGYSSLGRLRQMPVQTLKLDRMFLEQVPESREAKEIVLAILALANALGMGIVAEGVETEAQREFLLAHGCPLAQGFHLGRPVPPSEIIELLRTCAVDR